MLLIAKIHELFTKQNTSTASVSTTCWLSAVALTGTIALLMPMVCAIDFYYFDGYLKIGRVPCTATCLLFGYLYYKYIDRQLFRKNKIGQLVNKHRDRNIPAVLLYVMIVILPIFLICVGATITTLLFGGQIWGERVIGILK